MEVGFGAFGGFGFCFWVCAIFYVYSFWVFKGFALGGLSIWVGWFVSELFFGWVLFRVGGWI